MTINTPIRIVQDSSALRAAVETLQTAEWLALDTEFHAERRHQPELMLIQLNDLHGNTWIIDPLSVEIGPLGTLLADSSVLVHSGSQDLAIMWRETQNLPTTIFDVQLAVGMVGLGYPIRLNEIVAALLQVEMDKGETLSDWSVRPLSAGQLQYAAEDVEVLGRLADALKPMLEERGRTSWLAEECQRRLDQAKEPPRTIHTWVNWDIAPRLPPMAQRTLCALFDWRNQKGRDKNQPPNFMLSDGLALDIARRQPANLHELAANRRIPQGLIRRLGPEIVSVVKHAKNHSIQLPLVPTEQEQHRARIIGLWAEAWCSNNDLAPKLLMSDGLAHAVARDGTDALYGWRLEAVGEALDEFLGGKTLLGITETGGCLQRSKH